MYSSSNLRQHENVCIKFIKTISMNGAGAVWAAEYTDYSGEKIIIIPEDNYFAPNLDSIYLVQKPKGWEDKDAYGRYNNMPVFKRNIMEVKLKSSSDNIYIYTSDYYVPKCAQKKNRIEIYLRPSTYRNQFAMVWIEDDRLRKKMIDQIQQNVKHNSLDINKSDILEIEGANGLSMDQLEKAIISSINTCIKIPA